jgi:hypothetical protein
MNPSSWRAFSTNTLPVGRHAIQPWQTSNQATARAYQMELLAIQQEPGTSTRRFALAGRPQQLHPCLGQRGLEPAPVVVLVRDHDLAAAHVPSRCATLDVPGISSTFGDGGRH